MQPASVTLLPSGSQQFTVDAPGVPAPTSWSIVPQLGSISATGLYKAPSVLFISRTVTIIAWNGTVEIDKAAVTISAAPPWMTAISIFFAVLIPALFAGVLLCWPPPVQPPFVEVYPPVATLGSNEVLQFAGRINGATDTEITWTASLGDIMPTGLYTAPTLAAAAAPQTATITATRNADRTQFASAIILLVPGGHLVMQPSVVDASSFPAGQSVSFSVADGGATPASLNWLVAGPGTVTAKGVYLPGNGSGQQRAIISAVVPGTARKASAVVILRKDGTDACPVQDVYRREIDMLSLVILAGALGASLGGVRSYANFVGTRTFLPSWGFFYLSQPVFGAGLALIVFLGYRIGAFAGPKGSSPADPAAAGLVASLVGLFADTVLQKLNEIVTRFLDPADDRGDKINTVNTPNISSLSISSGVLTITGTNFVAPLKISINNVETGPSSVTPTAVTAPVPATAKPGDTLTVFVVSNGAQSNAESVKV